MLIVEAYHFLDADSGEFMGAAEIIEGRNFAELWDESGDFDTHVHIAGLKGNELFDVLRNAFAAELGIDDNDVYLTDKHESTILY
jgi:hypothetical protein